MGKVYFLFGIHNHQPVGNAPFVFEEAFNRCYKPFIDILGEFPQIKCNVHISGPLYDWILSHRRTFITQLKKMVEKSQIEIIGGAYYEPVLSIIPDKDKFAQIRLMNDFIKEQFGRSPKGMWLAERVWEPHLAGIIRKAGLKYTFLDDVHFRLAGVLDKELLGYYFTEDSLNEVAVFPINKTLRYKVPFSEVEEAISILKGFVSRKRDVLVTLFDDGEKFGMWPCTFDWVYKKRWLEKFFSLLVQNQETIETITAREALEKFTPNGLIYLPTSSYREMDEWVMEPEEFRYYNEFKACVKKSSKAEKFKNFIRAGFFRNFFRKYPRSHYMHKRMLYLSMKVHKKASIREDKEIFHHLWMSQCNCGYWHGLFGGFYLGRIRAAIYENLIKAEKELDRKFASSFLSVEKVDLNLDGTPETIVKNKHLTLVFSDRGATLLELSYKDKNFNLLNTITRREESYHERIEKKDKKEVVYDRYERLCLVDHLLDKRLTVDDFDRQRNFRTLSDTAYKLALDKKEKSVVLDYFCSGKGLQFSKKIILTKEASLKVEYFFHNSSALRRRNFGTEFNIFFQSPSDVTFYAGEKKAALRRKRVFRNINSLKIRDHFKDIYLWFDFCKADVFIVPVYSVSSSEGGLEKVCQQVSILFIKKSKENSFKLVCLLSKKRA